MFVVIVMTIFTTSTFLKHPCFFERQCIIDVEFICIVSICSRELTSTIVVFSDVSIISLATGKTDV